MKALFDYGWKLLISSLLELIYNNLYPLIIGRVYTSEDLAYYTKGQTLPNSLVLMINAALDKVLLPVMANVQDSTDRVRQMTRRSLQIGSFVMFPLMIGFAAVADNIVSVLLTDKWMVAVPFMRVFCVINMFLPIQTANLNAIKAIGRSDVYLKLDIIKRIVGIIVLFLTVRLGVIYMACGQIVVSIIGFIVNSYPNIKLLKYSFIEQITDCLPSLALSLLMGGAVFVLGMINISKMWLLVFQILLGAAIYVCGSFVCHSKPLLYLLDSFRSITKG